MQFFDRPTGRSCIALRGSSARPPTSQELLATAKRKREQRALLRKQHAAASSIQALYRARAASRKLATDLGSSSEHESDFEQVHNALIRFVLLSGLVGVQPNSLSDNFAIFQDVATNSVVPQLAVRFAQIMATLPSPLPCFKSRYPIAYSSVVIKTTVLLLASATHAIETTTPGITLPDGKPNPEWEDVIQLTKIACLLNQELLDDSLYLQAKWPISLHLSDLLRVCLSRDDFPHEVVSHLLYAILTVLERTARTQESFPLVSTCIRTQLALSFLSIDGVVDAVGLKSFPDAVVVLIHTLSAIPASTDPIVISNGNNEDHFEWDYMHSMTMQSPSNIATLISNILQLFHHNWSKQYEGLHFKFISLISSLIHALPKDVVQLSAEDDDDMDDIANIADMTDAETSVNSKLSSRVETVNLRAVVGRVASSLNQILSEKSVRKLFAAAVGEGHYAVLHVCELFNFLSRRDRSDRKFSTSLRDALCLWRVSYAKGMPHILASLWKYCVAINDEGDGHVVSSSNPASNLVIRNDSTPILYVFATAYEYLLSIQDSDEMIESNWPFHPAEIQTIASILKQNLFYAIFIRNSRPYSAFVSTDRSTANTVPLLCGEEGLFEAVTKVVSRLHAVDCQSRFTEGETFWVAAHSALSSTGFLTEAINTGPEVLADLQNHESNDTRPHRIENRSSTHCAGELLRLAPFLVPFSTRSKIFQSWMAREREDSNISHFLSSERTVSIRRQHMFDDAFNKLRGLGKGLRSTIRIRFFDEYGMEEAGIDGGGMFKEFLLGVLKLGFSPYSYGMFKSTPDAHLYPNPNASIVMDNFKPQFEFLGRLLGKALFDRVLVDVPLAAFFRLKMLGELNCPADLASLDPELYKNMKYLKNCPADTVEDIGLNFTVVNNDFGVAEEVELKPNGRDIPVTASNRIEYIHRLAFYRMNKQIKEQSEAFLKGFYDIIPNHYIRLFSHEELQLLISGKQGKIDLDDWRSNTRYTGGYSEDTLVIKWFWTAVSELDAEEQGKMLQFVTSCPRAPLLGFAYLTPMFCIQKAEGDVRLPTASTCMNLLKLPEYKSLSIVRQKIKYALQSNAGFDLS